MPQNTESILSKAKSTLRDANRKFPSAKPAASAVEKKPASVTPSPKPSALGDSTIGPSLKAKQDNINAYMNGTPKMHTGGEVPEDGVYRMKAGEHVLTAKQKQNMMNGMKALMKPAKKQAGTSAGPLPGGESTHATNVATLGAARSQAAKHDNAIKK